MVRSRFICGSFLLWMGIGLFVPGEGECTAPADSLALKYKRGLNTDAWSGNFSYNKSMRPGLFLSIRETLNSSRLKVRDNENKWKDQHHFLFTLRKALKPSLTFLMKGSSYIFTDYQSGYVNDSRTHTFVVGSEYKMKRIRFPAEIGVKEDRRFHRRDTGWTCLGGAEFTGLQWTDYSNTLFTQVESDFLGQRRNRSLRLEYDVSRQFHIDTYDSLHLIYNQNRRDYYISSEGEIESRDEQTQSVENVLSYRFSPGLRFAFEGRLTSRKMKIDLISGSEKGLRRERNDLKTQSTMRLIWKTKALSGDLFFGYSGEDQQYQLGESLPESPYSGSSPLLTPDNRGLYTTLAIRNSFRMSRSDTLFLMASLQRFRYDTPDPENSDDRDEMRIRSECVLRHTFSPDFSARIALQLHLLHFVYIFSDKSADNNWTRILRLSPEVDWRPGKRFRFIQSAEVLANYVDYDFDMQIPVIRSFLYRKYQMDDTVHAALSQNTSMLLSYRLELDENGKLLWENWREQRLTDRRSQTLNLAFTYKLLNHITLMPGYSFYYRTGYRYQYDPAGDTIREPDVNFKSHGPVMRVFFLGNRLNLGLSGSTILTQSIGIANQLLTRIDMHMRWAL